MLPALFLCLPLLFTEAIPRHSLCGHVRSNSVEKDLCRYAAQYISSSAITCNKSQLSTFLSCVLHLSEHIRYAYHSYANQKQLQSSTVLKYTEAKLQSNS